MTTTYGDKDRLSTRDIGGSGAAFAKLFRDPHSAPTEVKEKPLTGVEQRQHQLDSLLEKFENDVAHLLFKIADKVGAVMEGSLEAKRLKIAGSRAKDSPYFPSLCRCMMLLNILSDMRRVDWEKIVSKSREGLTPGGCETLADADLPPTPP